MGKGNDMEMIGRGIVDERSIIDVDYRDLYGFDQHHFFAGIGGWSYALRLGGWPDDKPVWTASLPCQPFSAAGKGLGKADERHLLPHFLELVRKCRPDVIFGEQVERAIAHGWLDDLQTTMEAENYAIGHCVLGAHSIGAAHIRQRLYWVADSEDRRREQQQNVPATGIQRTANGAGKLFERTGTLCATSCGRLSDSQGIRRVMVDTENNRQANAQSNPLANPSDIIVWIECRDGKLRPIEPGILPLAHGVPRGMVHSSDPNASQEARKMRLHGYGNAIVPQVAAEFINAYCSI